MDVIYGDGADLRHCASKLDEYGAQIGAGARKSDSGGMDLCVAKLGDREDISYKRVQRSKHGAPTVTSSNCAVELQLNMNFSHRDCEQSGVVCGVGGEGALFRALQSTGWGHGACTLKFKNSANSTCQQKEPHSIQRQWRSRRS